jgi:hypothetical protein
LEELLQEYFSIIEPLYNRPAELKKIKPVNFLIITDGYPSMPNHFELFPILKTIQPMIPSPLLSRLPRDWMKDISQ